MRFPQLIVYETDGRLARILEATAGTHRWALRQPRRVESCLQLLRQAEPALVVVKVENDLESAFTLVERTAWLFPGVAVVVVLDRDEAMLCELAWDLGAAFVVAPPQPRERLLDVVASLMGEEPNGNESA